MWEVPGPSSCPNLSSCPGPVRSAGPVGQGRSGDRVPQAVNGRCGQGANMRGAALLPWEVNARTGYEARAGRPAE